MSLNRPRRTTDLDGEKVRRTGKVSGGDIREYRSPEDYPGVEQYQDGVLYGERS